MGSMRHNMASTHARWRFHRMFSSHNNQSHTHTHTVIQCQDSHTHNRYTNRVVCSPIPPEAEEPRRCAVVGVLATTLWVFATPTPAAIME